ncbi:hypothetical protein Pan189_14720 [Stratiformator vulcanicus]|uniref:Uncharacterized protein n=1 Tax=Stratiformator vulcanicus TaxID=2527980 RepID=A0A517QZW2_9PLAN|nr:hypothetical protein Pan189_14720 [Stratiformator vulcanicus]
MDPNNGTSAITLTHKPLQLFRFSETGFRSGHPIGTNWVIQFSDGLQRLMTFASSSR